MSDPYAIILAGGASSRFWPLSGDEHPKYLLKPDGVNTLLDLAWQRATQCTAAGKIIVVTTAPQAHLIREALPGLDAANLCIEPARRDTAAAVTLGCKRVYALDANADVLVLPADTLLTPPEALAQGVQAARAQDAFRECIHVFGVKPTSAHAGFGYVQPGQAVGGNVSAVQAFKEKPGVEHAARMMDAGWLWNIGCFLFALPTYRRELGAHLPAHSSRLKPSDPASVSESDYAGLESISIDFGVIEKSSSLRVVTLQAEFDDIGSWDALLARLEKAGQTPDKAISIAGQNNHAAGDAAQVAVVGESDLLVVVSNGKVLVLKRGHGQDVKKIGR